MDDTLVERIARAMCQADGHDADSQDWAVNEPQTFGLGDYVHGCEFGAKWLQYRRMARRHLAAAKVLAKQD